MTRCVFLDMDGVLADLFTPSLEFHGYRFDAATYPPGEYKLWKVAGCSEADFWAFDSYEFWRELPKYDWADRLVTGLESRFGADNVCLLTAPTDHPECMGGKAAWIARHFPDYSRRVLYGHPKYFCAHPSTYLVDDSDDNCRAFFNAGGNVLKFPRVWNTLGERVDPVGYVLAGVDIALSQVAA